jgi:hypothetical protein
LKFEILDARQLLHAGELAEVAVMGAAEGEDPVPMPDFSLTDVNSTSATYNQPVSPRDLLQTVSAWYFGHAT